MKSPFQPGTTEIERVHWQGSLSRSCTWRYFWDHDEISIGGRVKADWSTGWTLIDLWVLFWCLRYGLRKVLGLWVFSFFLCMRQHIAFTRGVITQMENQMLQPCQTEYMLHKIQNQSQFLKSNGIKNRKVFFIWTVMKRGVSEKNHIYKKNRRENCLCSRN